MELRKERQKSTILSEGNRFHRGGQSIGETVDLSYGIKDDTEKMERVISNKTYVRSDIKHII